MRGHVRKRGSTWTAIIYLGKHPTTGTKRQHTKGGFPTRSDAQHYAHEVIHALRQGETWPAARLLTGQWLQQWIESRRAGWAGRTILRRQQILRAYLLPALGHVPLAALTPQHIQAVYAAAQRAGRAPNTIRAIHEMMATASKDALRQGLIRRDVAALVHPPQYAPRPMTIWDEEQVDLFLGACKHSRWWMLYVLAVGTGLRLGELTSLCRTDVDWELELLMVTRTQEKLPGEPMRFKSTKTHRSRRPVVLMPELLQPLRTWIDGLPATQQLLFSAGRSGLPLREETVREDFYRVIDRARLPRIRPHDLRHTHTSLLAHFKVPIKAIQERLGHSHPSTTLRMYTHILPSWDKETYREFGQRFFGGRKRIPSRKGEGASQ